MITGIFPPLNELSVDRLYHNVIFLRFDINIIVSGSNIYLVVQK